MGGGGAKTVGRKSLADFGTLDDGPAAPTGGAAMGSAAAGATGAATADGAAAVEEEIEEEWTVEQLQPLGLLRALLRLREW